jgi:hypothetical protein
MYQLVHAVVRHVVVHLYKLRTIMLSTDGSDFHQGPEPQLVPRLERHLLNCMESHKEDLGIFATQTLLHLSNTSHAKSMLIVYR